MMLPHHEFMVKIAIFVCKLLVVGFALRIVIIFAFNLL